MQCADLGHVHLMLFTADQGSNPALAAVDAWNTRAESPVPNPRNYAAKIMKSCIFVV